MNKKMRKLLKPMSPEVTTGVSKSRYLKPALLDPKSLGDSTGEKKRSLDKKSEES